MTDPPGWQLSLYTRLFSFTTALSLSYALVLPFLLCLPGLQTPYFFFSALSRRRAFMLRIRPLGTSAFLILN